MDDPQAAGSLTMKQISMWPEGEDFLSYFVCIEASTITGFPDIA